MIVTDMCTIARTNCFRMAHELDIGDMGDRDEGHVKVVIRNPSLLTSLIPLLFENITFSKIPHPKIPNDSENISVQVKLAHLKLVPACC